MSFVAKRGKTRSDKACDRGPRSRTREYVEEADRGREILTLQQIIYE